MEIVLSILICMLIVLCAIYYKEARDLHRYSKSILKFSEEVLNENKNLIKINKIILQDLLKEKKVKMDADKLINEL